MKTFENKFNRRLELFINTSTSHISRFMFTVCLFITNLKIEFCNPPFPPTVRLPHFDIWFIKFCQNLALLYCTFYGAPSEGNLIDDGLKVTCLCVWLFVYAQKSAVDCNVILEFIPSRSHFNVKVGLPSSLLRVLEKSCSAAFVAFYGQFPQIYYPKMCTE